MLVFENMDSVNDAAIKTFRRLGINKTKFVFYLLQEINI